MGKEREEMGERRERREQVERTENREERGCNVTQETRDTNALNDVAGTGTCARPYMMGADERGTTLVMRSLGNTERVYKNDVAMKVRQIEAEKPGQIEAIRHLVSGENYRKSFQAGHGHRALGPVLASARQRHSFGHLRYNASRLVIFEGGVSVPVISATPLHRYTVRCLFIREATSK